MKFSRLLIIVFSTLCALLAQGAGLRADFYEPTDSLSEVWSKGNPYETVPQLEVCPHDSEAGAAASEIKPESVEEFERDIESVVFVEKGQWVAGVSISYSQSTQNKYQFLVVEDLSGDTYSFKVSPMVLYVFKDDMGAGGKFQYARTLTKLSNADIVLDSETDYSIEKLYRLSHNYYGTAIFRNYFSIGRSRRFGFFNEMQLQLGGGQSKITTGTGQELSGVYERNFSLKVGLAPGMAVFLNDYSAMEVNVGVLGFNYIHTRGVRDQIHVSQRHSKSANFRINLFSITFGVAFYL